MHFTKSYFYLTKNIIKVIIVWKWIEYLFLSRIRKHYVAQKKAARRQAESESYTTKLWIKGVEFVGWIRSNKTQEKAWNLANCKYSDAFNLCSPSLYAQRHRTCNNSLRLLYISSLIQKKFKSLPAYFVLVWKYALIDHFVSRNWIWKWQINLYFVCFFVFFLNFFLFILN